MNIAKNEATDYSEMLISWLRVAYKSDAVEINEWIKGISEMDKDEQKNFFEYGLHFFRQYLFRMMTKSENVQLTSKEMDVAAKMEKNINTSKAEVIIKLINDSIENINRNINLRIMLFSDTLTIGQELRNN